MKNGILCLIMAAGSLSLSAQMAGDLDKTFGTAGKTLINGRLSKGSALGQRIEVLPDGSILVGGASQGQVSSGAVLTRFQPDGQIDNTWADAGQLIYMDEAGFRDMAIQADGKILVIGLEGLSMHRFNADGTPDYSFGNNGKLYVSDVRLPSADPMHIEVLPDGKILVGGELLYESYDLFLLRLMPDGSIDPGFGDDGLVLMDFAYYDEMSTFLVQPDGKIVATGATGSGNYDIWLARFWPDGAIDSTFGIAGRVIRSFSTTDLEYVATLLIQPDGKLIAGGFTDTLPLLIRFSPDGTLDSTFGNNGKSQVLDIFSESYIQSMALHADGKIIITAEFSDGWLLTRVTADGSADSTFATDGYYLGFYSEDYVYPADVMATTEGELLSLVSLINYDWASGVYEISYILEKFDEDGVIDDAFESAGVDYQLNYPIRDDVFDKFVVQPDGKILGKRYGGTKDQLVRILPDGTLDASFGQGGWAGLTLFSAGASAFNTLAQQPDGKIIMAGYTLGLSGYYELRVVRFTSTGQIDYSFGSAGVYSSLDENEIPLSAIVQPNGSILVAGYYLGGWFGTPSHLLLLRLKPNGTLDYSFGNNGKVLMQINGKVAYPYDIDLLPDGRILVAGRTTTTNYYDIPFMIRFQPNGVPDNTFGDQGGIVTTDTGGSIEFNTYDMAIRPDGAIVLAGDIEGYLSTDTSYENVKGFFIAQYTGDGVLDAGFGQAGISLQYNDQYTQALSGITLQPDGKIVGAGGIQTYTGNASARWAIWRFLSNGEPDNTWGEKGLLITEIGDSPAAAAGVFWLPEGKILAGGFASNGRDFDLAFARYYPGAVIISTVEKPGEALALRVQSPVVDHGFIWYSLKETSVVHLSVQDEQGKTIMMLMSDQIQAPGDYQMEIPVAGLPAGWYAVMLHTKQGHAYQIMVKS